MGDTKMAMPAVLATLVLHCYGFQVTSWSWVGLRGQSRET